MSSRYCLNSLAQQRAASACTAGARWHLWQHIGVDTCYIRSRQTLTATELALVVVGGFQVVEDLEAAEG